MGPMHNPGKGISQSALPRRGTLPNWLKLPCRGTLPNWLKLPAEDVEEQMYELAKKASTPSHISVILRDSHGGAQIHFVTGNKVLRILKKSLVADLPEDLDCSIKKAVSICKHLEMRRRGKDGKYHLIQNPQTCSRYYKTKKAPAPAWKYMSHPQPHIRAGYLDNIVSVMSVND